MPLEVRKIVFSKSELAISLKNYCKSEGIQVPDDDPQSIRFIGNNSSIDVLMVFASELHQEPRRIIVENNQVIEALINACKDCATPLPRQSKKNLQRNKDGIALIVGLSQQVLT